ncbi:MAG: helix-turn-helix transcriptional regulator [Firmicutes bacterium]|nr:helix-turn-helix transcriptional regulator [Bacillota bacterium]
MNKLRELRDKKGLTQEEIANVLGINSQYYSMLERGVRTPGFKLAKKIADFYECSVDEIFFDNGTNIMFADEQTKSA